ncbi:hypothetical protein MCOR10_000971 [Pyricularia oryzae]|nr:hypothetical protein MCOR10_000971 [Pyricularia oryzae]
MRFPHHSLSTCFRRCLTVQPNGLDGVVRQSSLSQCFRQQTPSPLQRQRGFSTCSFARQQQQQQRGPAESLAGDPDRTQHHSGGNKKATNKRTKGRGKNPLRAIAIKAQKQPPTSTRYVGKSHASSDEPALSNTSEDVSASLVTAVCVAEGFNMDGVTRILSAHGYSLDPEGTGFEPQEVVHARAKGQGDIFVFPSGTVVAWSLPTEVVESLAAETLLPAAQEPHVASLETEDLYFVTDPDREVSAVKGDDTVVLGTRRELRDGDRLDTTLAQIAFSSGLAQSTRLAVLEACLTDYFKSMRRLPENLSRGSDLRLNNRRFILQKTGELLSLRAQLNHYSELTDSLPDIFWENRGSDELNLESYFDQVGKSLDIRVRIRILNEKMDYAQEMASVLREMAAQKHGTRLEWIIIILIAVEVMFELRRVYIESTSSRHQEGLD